MTVAAVTIAGVDGCAGGWVAAVLAPDAGEPEIAVHRRFADLLEFLPADAIIAVDMPIGLPERCGPGGRGPEALVRPFLGQRQSSVFSIPSRAAVEATEGIYRDRAQWYEDHGRASAVARQTSDPPRGVSVQAYGIFARIRELDALLCADAILCDRIVEAHPELAFWRMNGRQALSLPKKVKGAVHQPGMEERRRLLAMEGLSWPGPPPRGAGADDVLDALAVLTVARRHATGEAVSYPSPPLRDAHGLPIAIHV